ncbi:MAG: class I tRNA ligase family protein [Planctomycetes bacterium]|jgi:valyl-tRNA synthetase|nr:class I tRNA ligase family protein [Planctomycetota bacterium]
MIKEMSKAYEPGKYEDDIYQGWEDSGFFNPDNLEGKPYSIMMPPPNVTGVLHLGHALENSLMDTMARYQRLQGKKVLLLPGTDHAAVATQAKVEKILTEKGIKNPREELGREELLKKIREFAENSKATIIAQIRKMGTSCDWSRLAYTFDEKRSRAVNEVFSRMYKDGLVYRGYRVVNWSVKGQSTCSDDELVYVERPAKLYYFKYAKDLPFTIATTRPETKLGDTAVAVNPADKRYAEYIGREFTADIGAKQPLRLKVIADKNVDPAFGTGVVGVTPAHSPIDYEMYAREKTQGNDIGLIKVIGEDGRMTEAAGKDYRGLNCAAAREKLLAWLEEKGLLEKAEDITQNIGTSDRFGDVAEALPMTQWFVNVNMVIPGRGKTLKDLLKEVVTTGHNGRAEEKIAINPERFHKTYLNWIDNLRDWCISRQIWWGHRIPVWHRSQKSEVSSKNSWDLKIYGEDIFDSLKNGSKSIELRAGRERGQGKYWGDFKKGDRIDFSLADTKTDKIISSAGVVGRSVKNVKQYKNLEEVFVVYDPEQDYPGKGKEELTGWWMNNPRFKERIEKHGIWVIELEEKKEEEIYVGAEAPKGEGWRQDEDTLDTWFSSGLWTFSTLGWPEETADLKTFHPSSWMQMGYEILFFWMARMILMSTYVLDEIPFRDVYIHGMLRDETGKKFSKSRGNTVDPIAVAKDYGTDALRLSLMTGIAPGNDSRFYTEKLEGARNLVNKLWNISRYILGNKDIGKLPARRSLGAGGGNWEINESALSLVDRWILGKLKNLAKGVTDDLDNYRFAQAVDRLREFTWDDLADWYLEASKFEAGENKSKILKSILTGLLKLWHPFIPFVTEKIWSESSQPGLLMVSSWPKPAGIVKKDGREFELVKNIIIAIRNARSENKVEPARRIKVVIYAGKNIDLIKAQAGLIKSLRTGIDKLEVKEKGGKIAGAIYCTAGVAEIFLLGAVDADKEKARLEKETANLEKLIASGEKKLKNKEFTAKAPASVVKKENEKLTAYRDKLKKMRKQLGELEY